MPRKRQIDLVDSAYQPTKVEKEEPLDFSHLEGFTPEGMARVLTQPVEASLIPKPRK